jgi:hypothetical protein
MSLFKDVFTTLYQSFTGQLKKPQDGRSVLLLRPLCYHRLYNIEAKGVNG